MAILRPAPGTDPAPKKRSADPVVGVVQSAVGAPQPPALNSGFPYAVSSAIVTELKSSEKITWPTDVDTPDRPMNAINARVPGIVNLFFIVWFFIDFKQLWILLVVNDKICLIRENETSPPNLKRIIKIEII